jgi:predicted transcriptional regulator
MARPRSGTETARVSTTLDRAILARLESTARANKVSTAWLIRWLIEDFLEKQESGNQPELPLRR